MRSFFVRGLYYLKIAYVALRQLVIHNGIELSGFIAYTVLVSLFPLLIFLFSLAGFFKQEILAQNLMTNMFTLLPPEISDTLMPIITAILAQERPDLLTAGIIGTIWAATAGVEALRTGLNNAYDVPETRAVWKRRLQSIFYTILAAMVGLALAGLIVLGPLALSWLETHLHLPLELLTTLQITRYLLAFLLLTACQSVLYRLLPNTDQHWRNTLPGALAASLLWLLLASAFSLYLDNFGNYDATYGSLGGVVITLLFLQVSALVFLLGAEVNAVLMKKAT